MRRVSLITTLLAFGVTNACSLASKSGESDGGDAGNVPDAGGDTARPDGPAGHDAGPVADGPLQNDSSPSGDAGEDSAVTSMCSPSNVVFATEVNVSMTMDTSDSLPQNIVAADMNHDGKTDLVVFFGPVAAAPVGVEVLLSEGGGKFASGVFYPVPVGNGQGMAIANFMGKGNSDVLVSSFDGCGSDSYANVLPNSGTGTLGGVVSSTVGWSDVIFMYAGDFTGDGRPDVAFVTNAESQVGLALNMGKGMFTMGTNETWQGTASVTMGPAFGDLDGDGVADVAWADGDNDQACVVLNDGKGNFGSPKCYPALGGSAPDTAAIGDVNGDGKNDLVLMNSSSQTPDNVMVYLNKGGGSFGAFIAGSLPYIISNLIVEDMNNDGKADVVVYDTYSASEAVVAISNGDGTLQTPDTYPLGVPSSQVNAPLAIGDFSGNGLRGMAAFGGSSITTLNVVTASCSM
jgi:VCBS repeat protein